MTEFILMCIYIKLIRTKFKSTTNTQQPSNQTKLKIAIKIIFLQDWYKLIFLLIRLNRLYECVEWNEET